MLQPLVSLLAFVSIALTAHGLGRPIVRGLGVGDEDRLSAAVWSLAVGLVVAGMLILGLGLCGLLYAPVIGVFTLGASLYSLGDLVGRWVLRSGRSTCAKAEAKRGLDDLVEVPQSPAFRWALRGVLAGAAAACVGSLVGALAPPTAGDALCYHLELPKTYLLEHRILDLPYHDNASMPLLTEMWYLWGLALEGGVCAQLVHWGMGVLLALATVVLATPIVGRCWAWFAGAIVVMTPGITNQMTAPLNDVALAAMTTLAFAAWWRAVVNDESRRWFVLAGILAGGALGIKYLALLFAAAMGVAWLWLWVRQRDRRRYSMQGAAIMAVVALSVGGIWYLRTAWYHGNPIHPFVSDWFAKPAAPWERPQTAPERKSPLGRGLSGLVAAPWAVTMEPERFGGRGHQLGVVFLAALPGLVVSRRLRGLGTLMAVGAIYFVFWHFLRQNVRFLFPAVPLLGVGAAWVWMEMRRFPRAASFLVGTLFAGIMAMEAVLPLYRARDQVAVAIGLESRDHYLGRHVPTYLAATVANHLLDRGAHILSQDYRSFPFDCRVTREISYRRREPYDQGRFQGGAAVGALLREKGFTHLLLVDNIAGGPPYDPILSSLVGGEADRGSSEVFLTLADYRFCDGDGALRRYRLVMLR